MVMEIGGVQHFHFSVWFISLLDQAAETTITDFILNEAQS